MERQSSNKQRDGAFKSSDFSKKENGWNKMKLPLSCFSLRIHYVIIGLETWFKFSLYVTGMKNTVKLSLLMSRR